MYFTTFNLRFSLNERTILVYVPQESGLISFIKASFYHRNNFRENFERNRKINFVNKSLIDLDKHLSAQNIPFFEAQSLNCPKRYEDC